MIDLKVNLSKGFLTIKNRIKEKKLAKILLIMIFFIAVGALAYNIGFDTSKKDKFIINLQKELEEGNKRGLTKYFSFSEQKSPLSEGNLQPFISFLSASKSRRNDFIAYLKSPEALKQGGMATLKEVNSFFGKKWTVELQPVYLNLSTDFAFTDIYINGSLYVTSSKDDFQQQLGPFLPGIYEIQASLKNNYSNCEAVKEVQLLEGIISLSISPPASKLTVKSNYPDGEVYINDSSTGLKVHEFIDFGPIPSNSGISIHIEKNFPWGRVLSEKKNFTDLPEMTLNLNPLTEDLRATLENTYREFYESFFLALTQDDISLIKHCSESVVKEIFNKYRSSALIIKDSYDLTSIEWEQNAISIKNKEGNFTASAIINLKYNKEKNIWGLPIYSRPDYLYFQTVLVYDEAEGNWYVGKINEIIK